ncbi:MAG: hypothetical protein E7111_03350 [Bacteroidales bacterium]|nr:hypothetical protein [Bacteroidales bacterium]
MKYLIRSIKYFFYFSILCSLIIGALIAIGAVEGNIDAIFDEGYRSIVKIGIFFIIVAAVYPKLGFITRQIPSDKSWEQARESIVKYMYEHNYTIESESPQVVTFRVRGALARLSKMYEDRITLTRTAEGWALEGLRKDAFRLANGIEHVLNAPVQES